MNCLKGEVGGVELETSIPTLGGKAATIISHCRLGPYFLSNIMLQTGILCHHTIDNPNSANSDFPGNPQMTE